MINYIITHPPLFLGAATLGDEAVSALGCASFAAVSALALESLLLFGMLFS